MFKTTLLRPLTFRRLISLQTVETPSENAIKFIAKDVQFLPEGLQQAIDIESLSEANEKSPLASELYKINGVKSIMIGSNFITVNKIDNSLSNNPKLNWEFLSPEIIKHIENFSKSKKPYMNNQFLEEYQKELDAINENDDDIVFEIKELLNTRIRPALQDDGGDIHFRSFDESTGTVYVKLRGACKSCSLSEDTLKSGIESMLKHYIPEVEKVKAVLDPEEEIAIAEFEKFEKKIKQGLL
jgi:Fe-S cluster biogenesis protein NfuA